MTETKDEFQEALVSVIVPTYNRADFIAATLDSIRNQSYSNFEVLIIDDGSTDDTERIVDRFIKTDSRFKYYKQKNSERAIARKEGLKKAQGEYICFLDSDDLWYSHKLERQINLFEQDPELVCVYSAVNRIDHKGQSLKKAPRQHEGYSGNIYHKLLERNFIASPSPLIRKHYLDKIGDQKTELIPYEDWDFWLRLSKLGKFYFIQEALADYRIHLGQSTYNVNAEHIEDISLKILEEHLEEIKDSNLSKRILSLASLRFAYWYILADKQEEAKLRLYTSIDLDDERFFDYRWWGLLCSLLLYSCLPNWTKKFLGAFH